MSPSEPEPIICQEKGEQAEIGSGGMDGGGGGGGLWRGPGVSCKMGIMLPQPM